MTTKVARISRPTVLHQNPAGSADVGALPGERQPGKGRRVRMEVMAYLLKALPSDYRLATEPGSESCGQARACLANQLRRVDQSLL